MFKKNPRATTLIPYFLLCQLLLALTLTAFPHQKDSLLQKLAEARKPDQQFSLLQQLYEITSQDNFQEAEKYVMAAVDLGMRTSNARYQVLSYKQLASLYELERNFMQAYIFYQEALKISIEEDYPEELPFLNYSIGSVLYRLDRYSEAITFLQNACSLAVVQKQEHLVPKALVYLGLCYHQSELGKKAMAIFDSLELASLKSGDRHTLSFLYYQLQGLHQHLRRHQQALSLNEKALNLFMADGDHYYTILCLKDRAALYMLTDSTEKAIACYRRALNEINNTRKFSSIKTGILDALSACYLRNADSMLAQSYDRQAKVLKDSLSAKGKEVIMPFQRAIYPGTLPSKKTNIDGGGNWPSRVIPLLLIGMSVLSFVIYRRYRKVQSNINEAKKDALAFARKVAEQEKQIEIRKAYELIEEEKQIAVHEANEIIEKAKAEARSLQAQIATTSVLLANKTEYLAQLQDKLNTTDNADFRKLAKEIKTTLGENDYWGEFIKNFNLLHAHTIDKITKKHPDLTPNEVKLVCFTLSGLTNKEIAGIFSVEPESVKKARYRLKKKLRLPEDESLRTYLDSLQ